MILPHRQRGHRAYGPPLLDDTHVEERDEILLSRLLQPGWEPPRWATRPAV